MSSDDGWPEEKLTKEDWQRYFIASGRVLRQWAVLEFVLHQYLAAVLRVDDRRARVIWMRLLNFNARRQLLRQLVHTFCDDQTFKQFDRFMDRCSTLSRNRATLAHNIGGFETEAGGMGFVSDIPDKAIGTNFNAMRELHIHNIEDWPEAITALLRELMDWLPEFSDAVQASPRTHSSDLDQIE